MTTVTCNFPPLVFLWRLCGALCEKEANTRGGNWVRSSFCREGFRLELLLFLCSENSQLRFESTLMLTNLALWRCSARVGLHACLCMTRKDVTVNVVEKDIVCIILLPFYCIVGRATWTQVCECNNSRRRWFSNFSVASTFTIKVRGQAVDMVFYLIVT